MKFRNKNSSLVILISLIVTSCGTTSDLLYKNNLCREKNQNTETVSLSDENKADTSRLADEIKAGIFTKFQEEVFEKTQNPDNFIYVSLTNKDVKVGNYHFENFKIHIAEKINSDPNRFSKKRSSVKKLTVAKYSSNSDFWYDLGKIILIVGLVIIIGIFLFVSIFCIWLVWALLFSWW